MCRSGRWWVGLLLGRLCFCSQAYMCHLGQGAVAGLRPMCLASVARSMGPSLPLLSSMQGAGLDLEQRQVSIS